MFNIRTFLPESSYFVTKSPYPKVLIVGHGSAYTDNEREGEAMAEIVVCRSMAENKNFGIRIVGSKVRTFSQKILMLNISESTHNNDIETCPFFSVLVNF